MTTRTSLLAAALLTALSLTPAAAAGPEDAPDASIVPVNRGALVVGPEIGAEQGARAAAALERAGLAEDEALLLRLNTVEGVPTLTIDATPGFLADTVAVAQMQWVGAHLAAEVFDGGPLDVVLTTTDGRLVLQPTETLGVPRPVTGDVTLYVGPYISPTQADGVAAAMRPVFDAPGAPAADWMLFRRGEGVCMASFGAMPQDAADRLALTEGVAAWLSDAFPATPICLESRARDLSVRARMALSR